MEQRAFWVYDTEALTDRLAEIKAGVDVEHGLIILKTDVTVDYETIVDAMDAAREVRAPDGALRTLFDQVVLSSAAP